MDEQFIFANPHCYIEEQNMSGRKLYCLREKATNRIVISNPMTDKEDEAIAMRDICPAFFTPDNGDEFLEIEGRVCWQDDTQIIFRYDAFLKLYL